MAKRLGLRGTFLETVEVFGKVTPRKQLISLASHRERIFCDACNRHFKHLEDRAIPVIEPMATGSWPNALDAPTQRLLAAWGAKTAFALIAAEKDIREIVPQDERRHLRRTGLPSENVWVGYAAWDGKAHKYVGESELEDTSMDPPPPRRANYQAVLTIGQLALKVFGMTEPLLIDRFRKVRLLAQVWPEENDDLTWPPMGVMIDENLDALVNYVPLENEQP